MKKLIVVLPVLALLLTGCTPVDSSTPLPSLSNGGTPSVSVESSTPSIAVGEPNPSAPTETSSNSPVVALLNDLTVTEETTSGYDRSLFKHWVSNNSTGCDTRAAVLIEESLAPVTMDGCKVVSGKWVSSYDNKVFTQPSGIDIDHMVPLAEAWGSGAYNWDASKRQSYANDLDYAPALVAVSAASNRSKSDRDPAEWLPETDACVYVANWVGVKHRWKLTVDTAEKNKILSVLSWCDKGLSVGTEANGTVTPAPAEVAVPAPEPVVVPTPVSSTGTTDPKFSSCKEAAANGFKSSYASGIDEEYAWYRDNDKDGIVCE